MHVGDLLAEMLMRSGVTHVFGVPGGQTTPLYQGIFDRRPGIDHVLMRDERSGVYAADGYARVSGRMRVCDGTVGPGATNLVSGLAEALNSSIPLLAVVADIPRGWEHRRPFGNASQGFRQAETLRPVSKALIRLDDPEHAAATIALAIRTAVSGRPGPVTLEIPDDVFKMQIPDQPIPEVSSECPPHRSVASDDALQRAVETLTSAARPILLAGSGAITSGAWDEVAAVAERLQAPVLTSITGKGAIASGHPLSAGVAGVFGQTSANDLLAACDTIFAVGCKLGQLTTFSWRFPIASQTLVQLDIDGGGIAQGASVALIGDARDSLRALLPLLPANAGNGSGWGKSAVGRSRSGWDAYNDNVQAEPGKVDPRGVLDTVNMLARPQDVLVCDASLSSGWGSAYFDIKQAGRHFVAPRGLAGLGWGGPAAIGAQAALGDAGRVFALIGDGAWAYSLAEAESAVRRELPIIFIILNNGTLGWMRHGFERGGKVLSVDFHPSDFAAAARSFGARGLTVGPDDDLEAAFALALRVDGPCVIDAHSSSVMSPVLAPPTEAAPDLEDVYAR
ncbi:MAG TPA: thiamine pyrophosphate-binding protein [Thermomicrobiales bacterium]|nr:thiamine pyrophosphate-binding protein [Thermomicrobiales bacterium]